MRSKSGDLTRRLRLLLSLVLPRLQPPPGGPALSTERDLTYRRRVLVVLGLLVTTVLPSAYWGVHRDAVPLATASAQAVLAVDTAKSALDKAQHGVDPPPGEAVAPDDFQTQISIANQSLALAASDKVTGLTGRQTLQTVTGLISVYTGWVEKADEEPPASPLRSAFRTYATSVFDGSVDRNRDASIQGRLDTLQAQQLDAVRRQSSFGWTLWFGWGTVLVAGLLLGSALVQAQVFSRRRFRRRWNLQLAAATGLLGLGVVGSGLVTWWTHNGMARSRALLEKPLAEDGIPRTGAAVAHLMAGTGFRAGLVGWMVVGGLAVTVLSAWGLWPYIREYRLGTPR